MNQLNSIAGAHANNQHCCHDRDTAVLGSRSVPGYPKVTRDDTRPIKDSSSMPVLVGISVLAGLLGMFKATPKRRKRRKTATRKRTTRRYTRRRR